MPTPNYSPDLERAQLLEDFKIADAKFNQLTGDRNDARLERAKLLLAMKETFPITKPQTKSRAGWREWCIENVPISYANIPTEISYASHPERLVQRRNSDKNRSPGLKRFGGALSALKLGWPYWTEEQRQKIIDRVVEYANA